MSRKKIISKSKKSSSDKFFKEIEALEEIENLEKELEQELNKVSSDSLLEEMINTHSAKPYQKQKRNRKRKTKKKDVSPEKPYHHGSLPQTLIEVASELIGTEGIKNLSLRKIAKSAGVSQAAPYRHFDDKEHLLSEVAKAGFYKLNQEMKASPTFDTTPIETIESLSLGYIKFAQENPSYFRMMFSSELSVTMEKHSVKEQATTPIKLFIDAILDAQEINLINPHLPTELIAMNLWSMIHGLAFLLLEKQLSIGENNIDNLREKTKKMLAMFLKGVSIH